MRKEKAAGKEKMTIEKVEELILGIDENETEAWKSARAEWKGGAILMPEDEMERRRAYRKMLAEIFKENSIDENTFPQDSWICGKIRRILKGGFNER